MTTPKAPGHFWAKWLTAAPGTAQGACAEYNTEWEVVQVCENSANLNGADYLTVAVPGEAVRQPLGNFEWGSGPLSPPAS